MRAIFNTVTFVAGAALAGILVAMPAGPSAARGLGLGASAGAGATGGVGLGGGMNTGTMGNVGGNFGGDSDAHISAQGSANTNGPNASDRDFGTARARDRMSTHGTVHARAPLHAKTRANADEESRTSTGSSD